MLTKPKISGTRQALLDGVRIVFAEVGVRNANMIEIADRSEVARATLYNHFRDKDELIAALIEDEIERMRNLIASAPDRREVLFLIANDISQNAALRKVLSLEPHLIAALAQISETPIWNQARNILATSLKTSSIGVEIALRWCISQFFAPIASADLESSIAAVERSL
jgi:AcrR family transcriptional regulator